MWSTRRRRSLRRLNPAYGPLVSYHRCRLRKPFSQHHVWTKTHAFLNLIGPTLNLHPRDNIAPEPKIATLALSAADHDGSLYMASWPLTPCLTTDRVIADKLINVRSQTGVTTFLTLPVPAPPPHSSRHLLRRAATRLDSAALAIQILGAAIRSPSPDCNSAMQCRIRPRSVDHDGCVGIRYRGMALLTVSQTGHALQRF